MTKEAKTQAAAGTASATAPGTALPSTLAPWSEATQVVSGPGPRLSYAQTVAPPGHGGSESPTLDAGRSPTPPRPSPDGLPDRLGRFEVIGEIGRGGMGRVLQARDPELRRTVAVKVIIQPEDLSDGRLARFVAEAQITSQLEHPHIVPVHEMGRTETWQAFFVMKKVEGRSLRAVLDALRGHDPGTKAEWTRHRLLTAFVQICHAVGYAHDRGVVHRDLKPDNIMLGAFGEVLVMDWGVARLIGDEEEPQAVRPDSVDRVELEKTDDGSAIGTPGFMAPEQAWGHIGLLDGRSDVWSLGAILYELLTMRPAYIGPTAIAVILAAAGGLPQDPRERAPDQRIPKEIVQICLRALAPAQDDRYATAADLAVAVEAFLAGSRRQEEAAVHLKEARALWPEYVRLRQEGESLAEQERSLTAEVAAWTPLHDPRKQALWTLRRRLRAVAPGRAGVFSRVIASCEGALAQDPGNPDARALLAQAYWERFLEAETDGDAADRRFYEDRVREHDDGALAAALLGLGTVTLRTDPPGAEAWARRVDGTTLPWSLGNSVFLGVTPLSGAPLAMGSWVLTIRAPGERDTTYPVHIPRGFAWDAGTAAIPLFSDAEIGEGFVYVPAGPFRRGGDARSHDAWPRSQLEVGGFFIATTPVTMEQWCEYVNELHRTDPDAAWLSVPRSATGLKDRGGQYWNRPDRDGSYVIPEVDKEGDRWDPKWPVFGVGWDRAKAYAAWRSEREGVSYRLPLEPEWEKAARGVDGRCFPWGDDFDSTLSRMRDSKEGRPHPEPVGSYPDDSSVYGVLDLAGNCRCWCDEDHWDGVADMRPVRGGSWYVGPARCRSASRGMVEPTLADATLGVRLVKVC